MIRTVVVLMALLTTRMKMMMLMMPDIERFHFALKEGLIHQIMIKEAVAGQDRHFPARAITRKIPSIFI